MKLPLPPPLLRALATLVIALAGLSPAWGQTVDGGQALEEKLRGEKAEALAAEAKETGDPTRGAIVFYQPYLTCTKCHTAGDDTGSKALGPDLARLGPETSGAKLVEAVLEPSKEIRKGFEPVTIVTNDGKTLTGILVEQTDAVVRLAEPTGEGRIAAIERSEIESLSTGKTSLMPAGLVNQLAGRQQFLDLIAYLIEIAQKGPGRALELKPAPALYAVQPLPEYEQHLDHAGLIGRFGDESFKRGEAIYSRVCSNCHGTLDRVGSLPTAPRFATAKFKNGSDPWAMYQTLTRGFGLMVPQTWMTPGQKYDVIGFIRQAYLKDHNPSQFVAVDAAYLERLAKGDTQGPEASKIEPWVVMDYGTSLTGCYEIGEDGANFAHKGIAIRLDPGPGGVSRGRRWLVFDTGTLRAAAAWSADGNQGGFIDWNGINFNGRHEVHPRVAGEVLFAVRTAPGWANLADGSFDDPRQLGRDGRHYGPLPKRLLTSACWACSAALMSSSLRASLPPASESRNPRSSVSTSGSIPSMSRCWRTSMAATAPRA
jgi:putative heme-binding domain-containing protein